MNRKAKKLRQKARREARAKATEAHLLSLDLETLKIAAGNGYTVVINGLKTYYPPHQMQRVLEEKLITYSSVVRLKPDAKVTTNKPQKSEG